MTRLSVLMLVGLLALGGVAQAQPAKKPPGQGGKKVTICHRTGSDTNPYVEIRVSKKAVKNGHGRHAEDIIPAPRDGCPEQPMTPEAGGTVLTATLVGRTEVPGPGDPDGSGQAELRLTRGEGRACFRMVVVGITLPATAAHVHVGTMGSAGGIEITLAAPGADGTASGCVTVPRSLVAAILAEPAGYYVNVHTSEFPDGAIRGQLLP